MSNNNSNQHAKKREWLECLESLPEPEPTNFVWGSDLPGDVFCDRVSKAYIQRSYHRRMNVFLLPFWKASKAFVQESADLLQAFTQKTSYECIAL